MLVQDFIIFTLCGVWGFLGLINLAKNSTLFLRVGIIILLFFYSQQLWKFFMWYELSMLPIIIIILGWGLNPSRFNATLYMIVYTIIFSLPCFIIFLLNYKILLNCFLDCRCSLIGGVTYILLLSLFFVKVPTFFLHYWLLKAHVEASTLGSIVLARGVLKIGGIGLWKILKWLKLNLNNSYILFRIIFARILSILQRDIKKLVAIISILHIRVGLSSLCTFYCGEKGFTLIRVRHTFSSGLIFYFRGILNNFSKRRLIYILYNFSFSFNCSLFILMLLLNLGSPPYFTIISEWVCFSCVFIRNKIIFAPVIITLASVIILTLCVLFSLKNLSNYSLNKSNMQFIVNFLLSLNFIWFYLEIL